MINKQLKLILVSTPIGYLGSGRGVEDKRRRSVKKELAQQVHLVQATKLLTSEHDVDKLSNTTLKVYATQATKKSLYE